MFYRNNTKRGPQRWFACATKLLPVIPPVVVAYDEATGAGVAYSRWVDGQISGFAAEKTDGRLLLQNVAPGTRWNLEGISISDPLPAERLRFVPSIISEWYSWSTYHPEAQLFANPAHPEVG